nr:MAG TPA: hypothetical protein [Caudoviricetes sp.]
MSILRNSLPLTYLTIPPPLCLRTHYIIYMMCNQDVFYSIYDVCF